MPSTPTEKTDTHEQIEVRASEIFWFYKMLLGHIQHEHHAPRNQDLKSLILDLIGQRESKIQKTMIVAHNLYREEATIP
jgi:hypothetical protein